MHLPGTSVDFPFYSKQHFSWALKWEIPHCWWHDFLTVRKESMRSSSACHHTFYPGVGFPLHKGACSPYPVLTRFVITEGALCPILNKELCGSSPSFCFYNILKCSLIIALGTLISICLLFLQVPCGFVEAEDLALLISVYSQVHCLGQRKHKKDLSNQWNSKSRESPNALLMSSPLTHSITHPFIYFSFMYFQLYKPLWASLIEWK